MHGYDKYVMIFDNFENGKCEKKIDCVISR